MAGIAAWLLGACAATGGSLLAVSLIGKGMVSGIPSQADADAVKVSDTPDLTAGAPPTVPASTALSAVLPATPGSSRSASGYPHPHRVRHQAGPQPSAASPADAPTLSPTPDGTVLGSAGGEVVAACPAAGAELLYWSPQQGYEVSGVSPGPAATAQISFSSDANGTVVMTIACQGGVPVASTQQQPRDD